MSLINEALKKAQRERAGEPADPAVPLPAAGPRIVRRGKAHSANTMVLAGSGALALVVLSVVVTVFLLNRPDDPPARSASAASTAPAPAASSSQSVTPATPTSSTPASSAPAAPTPAPAASPSTPEPVALAPVPVAVTIAPTLPSSSAPPLAAMSPAATDNERNSAADVATPGATEPRAISAVAETPPSAAAPLRPNERVTAFVEAVRVTGIRSSGAESRVLMNDRVYRVNDIVERTLGLRLVEVGADTLTFSDANGVKYVKNF